MTTFGVTPSSEIWLLNVPELEPSYSNTYDFDLPASQERFFKSRVKTPQEKYVLSKYSYLRKDSVIRIGIYIDDIHDVNYIMYKNTHGKWYYAFIIEKRYINEKVTELIIATDLLQTYMFDYTLEESYVDRCHVDRWKSTFEGDMPTNEFENEGLEFGEYIQEDTENIYTFNKSFIAVCSSPLGVLENRRVDTGGGQGGGDDEIIECGDWKNGIISPQGLRFIKGEEGYAPRRYWDKDGKVWTIGYGITQPSEKRAYDYLDAKNPASEEDCAKVSYYIKNERYGKPILPKCIEMGITEQYEFDALVSFAYNLGIYIFTPTSDIYKVIVRYKKGQATPQEVIDTFKKYNKSGGRPLPGLTKRREQEGKMFCKMPYDVKQIDTIIDYGKYGPPLKGDGWLPDCKGQPTGKYYNAYGERWYYPTQNGTGTVTSLFGKRIHPITGKPSYHKGIDIGGAINTPIYAIQEGEVISAGNANDGYGNKVIIQHKNDIQSWYCHNNILNVKVGDKVRTGQQIAGMGKTGNVTGVHLHYEQRTAPYSGQNARNPIPNAKVGDKI